MLIARKECKVHLEQPHQVSRGLSPVPSDSHFIDLMRQRIFDSRKDKCGSREQLGRLYAEEPARPISCRTLAHIVSCPLCLERVNDILGVPPLSDRFPTDMLGNDAGPRRGNASDISLALGPGRRLARSTYEHIPDHLIIMVNGFFTASERVSSGRCERVLALKVSENISTIEAFSEQGVRLLGLHVEAPPAGDLVQRSRITLSEGRSLELAVSFEDACPTLITSYNDPCLEKQDSCATVLAVAPVEAEPSAPDTDGVGRIDAGTPSPGLAVASLPVSAARIWPRFISVWRGMLRWILPARLPRLRINPALITALFACVLIATFVFLHLHVTPVSAAELLQRASIAESNEVSTGATAVHRRLVLEERSVLPAFVLSTHRIDIWTGPAGLRASRVYDENGRLLAGEWVDGQGTHSVYRLGGRLTPQKAPDLESRSVFSAGDIWRLGATAAEFLRIVGAAQQGRVERKADDYMISYDLESAQPHLDDAAPARIVLKSASIMLTMPGLRPMEEKFLVQRGGDLVEYRFTEDRHDAVPMRDAPSVFHPDAGIRSQGDSVRIGALPGPAEDVPLRSGAGPLSDAELAALKIDVIYQLHRVGACVGGEASFARAPDGALSVKLLVESDRRRSELRADLASLASTGRVRLDISTYREAAEGRAPIVGDTAVVRRYEVRPDQLPASGLLRQYLQSKAPASEGAAAGGGQPGAASGASPERLLDEKVRAYALEVLGHSRQALVQAAALRRHAAEIRPADFADLPPEEAVKAAAMMRDHLSQIERETAAIAALVEPVLGQSPDSRDDTSAAESTDVFASVDRLFDLVLDNDREIRAEFSISLDRQSGKGFDPPRFWRSITVTRTIAKKLMAGRM